MRSKSVMEGKHKDHAKKQPMRASRKKDTSDTESDEDESGSEDGEESEEEDSEEDSNEDKTRG